MERVSLMTLIFVFLLFCTVASVCISRLASHHLDEPTVKKGGGDMWVSLVFVALVYFLAGSIVEIPYVYLAGSPSGRFVDLFGLSFLTTAVLAPLAILIICVVYAFIRTPAPIREGADGRKRLKKLAGDFFCLAGLVVYFLSPVLLNGISLYLKWSGYEAESRAVFSIRYWALLIAPAVWLLWVIVTAKVRSIIRRKNMEDMHRSYLKSAM